MKKILTAALLAGGLIMATATAASAHHPIVSGETVCAEDGQQTITWTMSNSESVSGTNRTMTIDQVSIDRGEVGFTVGQVFAPTPTAGSSQTSTSTYDGDETGDVTLTVRTDFSGEGAPQNILGHATVELVGDCVTTETTATTATTTTTTTTTTTAPPLIAPPAPVVQPVIAEKAVVVPTEVKGVTLTAPAPAPVGGVQTGGGGTSQSSGNPLLPLGLGLGCVALIGLVTMQLRRRLAG